MKIHGVPEEMLPDSPSGRPGHAFDHHCLNRCPYLQAASP